MAIVVYNADEWTPKRDEGICSRITTALDLVIEDYEWSSHPEDCECDWLCNKPRLY